MLSRVTLFVELVSVVGLIVHPPIEPDEAVIDPLKVPVEPVISPEKNALPVLESI